MNLFFIVCGADARGAANAINRCALFARQRGAAGGREEYFSRRARAIVSPHIF